MDVNIQSLLSESSCYETLRNLRWPSGNRSCAHCASESIIKRGKDERHHHCQRYLCKTCGKRFDDLTNTIFSGHHQPLATWMIFLYFMGLNLSTSQISKELNLNKDDAHDMSIKLRKGVVEKKPMELLSGEVECDEVYVVAGHKGNSEAVKKKAEKDDAIA